MSEDDRFSVVEEAEVNEQKVLSLVEEFKATMMVQGLNEVEKQLVLMAIAGEFDDFAISQPMSSEEHGLEILTLEKTVSTSVSELQETFTEEEFEYFQQNLEELEEDERVPDELIEKFKE